jgi:hypothetical protein
MARSENTLTLHRGRHEIQEMLRSLIIMLKEKQHMIAAYFESHGIPVETRIIRGGLSVYTKARKTPITRFIPTGTANGVEFRGQYIK